jgi:Domain of unknown function (DUF4276)
VTEIRIYFEGDKALRSGFNQFLTPIREEASKKRVTFHLIAGKATAEADFRTAQKTHPNALNVLLQDAEASTFQVKDSVFWMVQLMEAWFLADPDALDHFYGDGFRRNALRQNPQVEQIPKADVLKCLNDATRETQKGRYHKTRHAPKILEWLDRTKVRAAAPNCERLFRELLAKLDE